VGGSWKGDVSGGPDQLAHLGAHRCSCYEKVMVGIRSGGEASEVEGALGGRAAIVGLTRRAESMLTIFVAIFHFAVIIEIDCRNEDAVDRHQPLGLCLFFRVLSRRRCAYTYVACV